MNKYTIAGLVRLVASLLMALTVLPAAAGAQEAQPAGPPTQTVSGELRYWGSWAAYSFPYPGDGSKVRLTLIHAPADPFADEAVTLDAYGPSDPPPNGAPVGSATQSDKPGVKRWSLGSDVGGTYVVVVTNWDYLERPVQFSLSTADADLDTPGPPLTFVSSGPRQDGTATSAPSVPASTDQGASVVGGELPARGGWLAYSFFYPGGNPEVRLRLDYDPADPFTDEAVTFDVYAGSDPPPGGTAIASLLVSRNPGIKEWTLRADASDTYIVVVHNWDPGRRVRFTLSTANVTHERPGPGLTFVSSGT